MNAKPTFARPSSLSLAVTVALATFIAIGLLTAVALLFQRYGAPMEQLAAAERACTQRVYISERQPACANGSPLHTRPTSQANSDVQRYAEHSKRPRHERTTATGGFPVRLPMADCWLSLRSPEWRLSVSELNARPANAGRKSGI
jgi:hypothetical protein